jgi:transposase
MCQNPSSATTVISVDTGKNSFHVVGLDDRGAIILRQKWSRGQIEGRLANMPLRSVWKLASVRIISVGS